MKHHGNYELLSPDELLLNAQVGTTESRKFVKKHIRRIKKKYHNEKRHNEKLKKKTQWK